jgi:hypothetical protein
MKATCEYQSTRQFESEVYPSADPYTACTTQEMVAFTLSGAKFTSAFLRQQEVEESLLVTAVQLRSTGYPLLHICKHIFVSCFVCVLLKPTRPYLFHV